ncbi:hypothetical protein Tco_0013549 [Tanacetum coccineum]
MFCLREATNKQMVLVKDQKESEEESKLVGERKQDWIGELLTHPMAYRTMIKSSNGETPFLLTYNTEAVSPQR